MIAWLIEREGPRWLYIHDWSGFSWTPLPSEALRLARREDAEQLGKLIESVDWKATEHIWE